ncbi:MAG: hypothetical protein Kow0074_04140 [Candidatus Zixiibacteriota bacterium]
MRIRHIIFAAVLAICTNSVSPAQYTKEWSPWPVIVNGQPLALPFWGGINSPKPSLEDFNGDGLIDLFIGETRGKVSYLMNTGTPTDPVWTPVQERLGNVDAGTWHTLCDIDADGDLDLFCDAQNGQTAFYKNISSGGNIIFKLEDSFFGNFGTGFNNTADFADIDADGDYDFFWGPQSGALEFFRNDGDSANPSFTFVTDFYDSVLAFPGVMAAEAQHGFSAIQFADVDSDNDLDLFYGDIFNFNLYYFENLGVDTLSDLTKITEDYLPFATFGYNHTAFGDLDGDGDLDMVVGSGNEDLNNLYYLERNAGSYTVIDSNMVENIDLGSYAFPALGDIDGDGDIDMLLGSDDGRLRFFENTGTAQAPAFTLQSDFYKGIDVGLSSAPVLVDWDCDADLDLLIGTDDGRIEFWRNEGSPTVFDPVQVTNQLAGIQVDQLASARPVDWNNDGLRDLVIGEWDFNGFANVLLYQNVGNNPDPTLVPLTFRLLKREPRDLTLPQIVDWDDDGREDMIIGHRYFGFTVYRNTAPAGQFPDSLTLVALPDTVPGYDDGYRLSIAFADIDADGDDDVFIGEEDGGVNFHRRDGSGLLCDCSFVGDMNGDAFLDAVDLNLQITVLFFGADDVQDASCPLPRSDVTCDGASDAVDLNVLINTLFFGGPPLCDACTHDAACP